MTDLTGSLRGRAALVTGASRGIGHAIAAELLTRGASVTITARKPDELAAAAKELVEGPAEGAAERVLTVVGNAGSADSRAESVDRTVDAFGRLDILINNAGVNPVYGPLVEADLDAVRKIFDVNVVAAIGFVQLAYEAWMRDNGGAIVNLASAGGLRSTGVIAAYGGVQKVAPVMAGTFLVVGLATLSLPGLAPFISEFLVLLGTFTRYWLAAAIGVTAIVLAAIYVLWLYQRMMTGPVTDGNERIRDLLPREMLVVAPLMALLLFLGVYPKPVLDVITPAVSHTLTTIHQNDPTPSRSAEGPHK